MLRVELFATAPTPAETLWDVVGDLGRLDEWTDADAVEDVPGHLAEGATFATVHHGERLLWTVITAEAGLIEAKTDTACGRLGIGVRVVPDAAGSRVILAGMLKPSVGSLRARAVELPRLRRRFDGWTSRAVDVATREA